MLEKSKILIQQHWKEAMAFTAFFFLALSFCAPTYGCFALVFGPIFAFLLYQEKKRKFPSIKGNLYWLIPLGLLFLLPTIFEVRIGNFIALLLEIFNLFSLVGYLLLGVFLKEEEPKMLKRIFIAILLSFSLVCWVSFIGSMASYGAFHAALYEGKVYYWEGAAYLVAEENVMFSLTGLNTVSLRFASTLPFLLSLTGLGLFFISMKENKILAISLGFASFTGLLYLALTPDYLSLILLACFLLCTLALRFLPWKEGKILPSLIIVICFVITLVATLVIFGLAYSGNDIYGSGVMRKLFDNQRFMEPINQSINAFSSGGWLNVLFGLDVTTAPFSTWNNTYTYWYEINLSNIQTMGLEEGGILCFMSLTYVFFLAVFSCYVSELKRRNSHNSYAVIFSLLAMGWILFNTIQGDAFPYIEQNMTYVSPIFGNGGFALFTFALAFSLPSLTFKREEKGVIYE